MKSGHVMAIRTRRPEFMLQHALGSPESTAEEQLESWTPGNETVSGDVATRSVGILPADCEMSMMGAEYMTYGHFMGR